MKRKGHKGLIYTNWHTLNETTGEYTYYGPYWMTPKERMRFGEDVQSFNQERKPASGTYSAVLEDGTETTITIEFEGMVGLAKTAPLPDFGRDVE